ncbi:MAG TPA: alpha/beta hydrolase [Phenylobacterium sp.]|jgi:pimeloyl-ACP methyl ester carboxylesterase|nr:alpha/beta hydrolase [Phenylobacterium sp.]
MNRRHLMHAAFAAGFAADLAAQPRPALAATRARPRPSAIRAADGASLAYTDRGAGAPVVLVHAWAMHSQMWDRQVEALTQAGLRVVTFDRRGHGRSPDPGRGYDMDTLADDLAAVLDQLDLTGVTLVGHSMGGAEVIRYLARHGDARVRQAVLLAPAAPFLTQTPDNPTGVPAQAFEQLRAAWVEDFPKWAADNAAPFFTPRTSPETVAYGVRMMLECPLPVALACNRALVATDLRGDCGKITTPTLIVHGDADQSAPLEITGKVAARLIPNARLQVVTGAPHGLYTTHAETVNRAILEVARV